MVEADLEESAVLHAHEQARLIGREPAELTWVLGRERRDLPHHVLVGPLRALDLADCLLEDALTAHWLLCLLLCRCFDGEGLQATAPNMDRLLVSAGQGEQPRALTEA